MPFDKSTDYHTNQKKKGKKKNLNFSHPGPKFSDHPNTTNQNRSYTGTYLLTACFPATAAAAAIPPMAPAMAADLGPAAAL